jgi:glycosyltransferase involved in cell wall biosynthesis
MNTSKLAIILPHYNYEEYILELLDSIKNQTYKDFTLYIVDDASTDNSVSIIKEFISGHPEIKINYIRHESNKFIGSALNSGHTAALSNNHKFISWITSDNIYSPNCFEELINCIESSNKSFIYSSFYYLFPDGTKVVASKEDYFTNAFIKNRWSQGMCFIYKKEVYEIVGSFAEGINHVQDYDYCVRMELNNIDIGYLDKQLGYCRCHRDRRSYLHVAEIDLQREELYKRYGI